MPGEEAHFLQEVTRLRQASPLGPVVWYIDTTFRVGCLITAWACFWTTVASASTWGISVASPDSNGTPRGGTTSTSGSSSTSNSTICHIWLLVVPLIHSVWFVATIIRMRLARYMWPIGCADMVGAIMWIVPGTLLFTTAGTDADRAKVVRLMAIYAVIVGSLSGVAGLSRVLLGLSKTARNDA